MSITQFTINNQNFHSYFMLFSKNNEKSNMQTQYILIFDSNPATTF